MDKFYISSFDLYAAKYIASVLLFHNYEVVSTWHEANEKPATEQDWTNLIASRNDPEIRSADALVLISSNAAVPGGKFVEAGMMLGLKKPVLVLGRIENRLLRHPLVKQCDNEEQLLECIQLLS